MLWFILIPPGGLSSPGWRLPFPSSPATRWRSLFSPCAVVYVFISSADIQTLYILVLPGGLFSPGWRLPALSSPATRRRRLTCSSATAELATPDSHAATSAPSPCNRRRLRFVIADAYVLGTPCPLYTAPMFSLRMHVAQVLTSSADAL